MEKPLPMTRAILICIALAAATLLGACATTAPSVTSATPAPVETARALPPAAAAADSAASAPLAAASAPATEVAAAEAPIDPLRPEVPVNIEDRGARKDLWQRIRDGFAIADLDDGYVRKREQYYASRPDYVDRMTDRGSRYLFHIVEEVQRRGLPTELALLPFIESAFNPTGVSSARASGLWQFMPATGRHFDLKQNVFRDDRRDVLSSTRAALDYLTYLHKMFGDWHLALAAYNWGEGNVQRAIRANRAAGRSTSYTSLKMPNETRDYVPKLQAMKNIVANPGGYALALPPLENHPYFLAVPIGRDIDVALAAKLAEMPLDDFKALNPQMNKPVILAAGTPQILLPYDNATTFVTALPHHKGPLASWTAWTTPRAMKSAEAAKLVGMDEDDLRSVNNIPPRMKLGAGSTLLVHRNGQRSADVPVRLADTATISLSPEAPPLRRVAFKAGKKGDSVAAVAKRYKVSTLQVAQWNKVPADAQFKPGSTVVVHVAAAPAKGRSTAKATKKTRSTRVASASHNGKRVR
jgi:membrane-bound lytic murein transglycosylase D